MRITVYTHTSLFRCKFYKHDAIFLVYLVFHREDYLVIIIVPLTLAFRCHTFFCPNVIIHNSGIICIIFTNLECVRIFLKQRQQISMVENERTHVVLLIS